jgi:arsenate reductase-like glutaredoxin family protein
MRDELTNKTMNMTDKELKELYAQIQKGYDELMEKNRQTIEWMKSVGLQK